MKYISSSCCLCPCSHACDAISIEADDSRSDFTSVDLHSNSSANSRNLFFLRQASISCFGVCSLKAKNDNNAPDQRERRQYDQYPQPPADQSTPNEFPDTYIQGSECKGCGPRRDCQCPGKGAMGITGMDFSLWCSLACHTLRLRFQVPKAFLVFLAIAA